MNNEWRYVILGGVSAIIAVIIIISIQSYIPAHLFKAKEPVAIKPVKKDSVHIIANIEGQILFNENCTACHRLFGRVDGPSVKGVENRVKDRKLLYEWIRNSSKVLESGNAYFNQQFHEYGVAMPAFPQLTNEQIDAILNYIKEVEEQDSQG